MKRVMTKGYRYTSIGQIPKEWQIKRLIEIGEIFSGGTPDTTNIKFWNGDVRWCTPTDISTLNGEIFICDTSVKITNEGLVNSSAKLLPIGTVIVCTRATIGKAAIACAPIATNQGFKNIIPKNNINSEYLYYTILFSENRLLRLGNGSTFLEVSKNDFGNLEIAVPSFKEQLAIVKLMSIWEQSISAIKKIITQKQARKKWLMQMLLTGKKRLKGFEKTKWLKKSAGDVFQNVSIKGFDNEDLLSSTQDKGIVPRRMLDTRVTMPAGETKSFKLVEKGDFVISLRSFQGGLEYSNYRGLVSPAYTVLKPKVNIDDGFYRHYFKSYDFIGRLAIAVIGIRDGKQISYDDFCTVKVPTPAMDEQIAIAAILNKTDIEINLLAEKLNQLKQQKKGLMQVLLTGKKRLVPKK